MTLTVQTMMRVRESLMRQGITWDMAKAAMAKATFAEPTSPTTGINYYDLEPITKRLTVSYTPVRQSIPRRPSPGGTAANWREVTKLNTAKVPIGVPSGHRGPELQHEVKEFTAKYVNFKKDSSVEVEAELAARGFDDVRALQAILGLRSVQNDEEVILIGGLGTYGFGKAPTVSIATSTTAGSLSTSTTYHVRVVALTAEGLRLSTAPTATVPGQLAMVIQVTEAGPWARTYNVNGGASQISDDNSLSTGTATALDVSCAAVPGAAGYAWFLGTNATNGTCVAITSVNKATLTKTLAAGTPPTGFADTVGTNFDTDHSQNSLVFDGIMGITAATGSGGHYKSLDGASLNGDNAAGIVEIDALLRDMATVSLTSPSDMYVNFAQVGDITAKILSGGSGAQLYHIVMEEGPRQGSIMGGSRVVAYQNKYALDPGRQSIAIHVHPNVPPGTIILTSRDLPPVAFPDANISSVLEVETRQEYLQREWPMTTEQYETGVSVQEVLKCYFAGGLGLLQNVGVG